MSNQSLLKRIATWLWWRKAADPDLNLVLDAAEGRQVDQAALASAYWRMYYGTYHPREEWHALPREKRTAVYRIRLRLISAYGGFSRDHQDYVTRMRPPPPKL